MMKKSNVRKQINIRQSGTRLLIIQDCFLTSVIIWTFLWYGRWNLSKQWKKDWCCIETFVQNWKGKCQKAITVYFFKFTLSMPASPSISSTLFASATRGTKTQPSSSFSSSVYPQWRWWEWRLLWWSSSI